MMKPLPMAAMVPNERMDGDEEQIAYGLIHTHNQMNVLAQQVFAAAAQVRAMATVLNARGLIDGEELTAQRAAEEQGLLSLFQDKKVGVRLNPAVPDKYAIPADQLPHVDCENRLRLCHGACCALRFPLSRQDLEEGVMRWELSEPYLNRQARDGRCVHQDRGTLGCTIYEHRPSVCRIYSCRGDERIWQDFDAYIINPDLFGETPDGERFIQFPPEPASPAAEPRMDQPAAGAAGPVTV